MPGDCLQPASLLAMSTAMASSTLWLPISFSSNVGVLLGNGDGTFQHVVTYGSGGSQNYSVALADVNGDNMLDIVTVNQNGFVGILLGKGDATFYPALRFATNQGNGLALAVGDLNGDAKPDVVVGGDLGVSVLLGNGDGTLQKSVIYSSGALQGGQASRVVIADFNRDGKPDVATANYATDTVSMLGNGDGTMQSVVTYASGAPDAWSLAEQCQSRRYSRPDRWKLRSDRRSRQQRRRDLPIGPDLFRRGECYARSDLL